MIKEPYDFFDIPSYNIIVFCNNKRVFIAVKLYRGVHSEIRPIYMVPNINYVSIFKAR